MSMTRDFSALTKGRFDVVVIGGGINGAGVAWDAALRGLKVALIEKKDFGHGASSGCFKTVHSGLRYLQHLDFMRLRESVVEQRILRQIAPHLVHPLPFLIPCYGHGMKGKEILTLAMYVFEALAIPRNQGIDKYHYLPPHQLLTREQCLQIAPKLNPRGLTGGVIYYDCQMSDCERLTFSVAKAASQAGAVVCNYAEVLSSDLSMAGDEKTRVTKLNVRDVLTGAEGIVETDFVINAAGPWIKKVLERITVPEQLTAASEHKVRKLFTKGIQIVVPQFIKNYGIAIESDAIDEASVMSRGGRSFFVFPWRGHSLVGTTDELLIEDPDSYVITKKDVNDFIADFKQAYPTELIDEAKIRFAFGGYRPVERKYTVEDFNELKEKKIATASRDDLIIDHSKMTYEGFSRKLDNVMSVEGVKYTTFRKFAEHAVNKLVKKLGRGAKSSLTSKTPIPGGDIAEYQEFVRFVSKANESNLPKPLIENLIREFGSETSEVLDLVRENSEWLQLVPGTGMIKAGVVYATRNEIPQTLSDLVLRRTGIATLGHPGEETLREVSAIMAKELGWDEARRQEEIEKTESSLIFS